MTAPRPDLRNPVHLLAFGLGSGCAPKAPGTFGTLAAVPFFLLLALLPLPLYLLLVVAAFGLGVWLCERTSRDLGVHDHGGIVWDEFVGLWLALVPLVPTWQFALRDWLGLAAGVVLFRIFDILKPWPIRWLDARVHGGFGIMIDDVVAGIVAAVILALGLVGLGG